MLFIAQLAADNRITSSIGSIDSRLGRIITRTPAKPIATAAQRRGPTCSCSTSAAIIVANKGAVKLTAGPGAPHPGVEGEDQPSHPSRPRSPPQGEKPPFPPGPTRGAAA